MNSKGKISTKFGATIKSNGGIYMPAKPRGIWHMKCYRDGEVIWQEDWENIIVNQGLDYLIDVALGGATQITTWYLGLVNGATPSFLAADTLASKSWTEDENYNEAVRQTWVDGGLSGVGSLNNSGSVASFLMNATTTIGGAFLASDSTKGGTTGTLYAEGDFATDRNVIANDILEVTATFSVADDGV